MARRRINPLTTFGVPLVGGGVLQALTEYQWFVDYNWGGAFGDGRAQDHPLKYLQDAIDRTVDNRGDVIYVGQGGAPVTETVTFNKSGISVIAANFGIAPRASGEFHAIYAAAAFTDGPVATITAPCFIHGMGFASRDTGALFFDGAAVLVGGAAAGAFGVHMKYCRFPKWGLANRIGLSFAGGEAISNCTVDYCDFEGAFAAGIYVQGAVGHLQISNTRFNLATYAIQHGAFADAGVHSQLIYGPGNHTVPPTKFLNSGSNAMKGIMYGNFLGTAVGTSTNDINVADLETAGMVQVGNEYATEDPGPT